jgi:predicted MPP superfamily phosphohydrolase
MGRPDQGRRGPSKALRAAIFALVGGIVCLGIYATQIEPSWIEVTHHRVAAPISPPIKIAHLTDLHTRELGRPERRLLALLAEEKPDLIVITGDITHNDAAAAQTRPLIERLHAPLGVWMVRGNWETWNFLVDVGEFFRQFGIHYLENQNAPIREGLWMVGLDDPRSGHPDPDAALAGVPAGVYSITLVHGPVMFDQLAGRTNLVLAGHTHGGQVRLPFLPPLWLPQGSGSYSAGWYELRGTRMYVSRGIGMSVLPVRFLCRPELTIITLGN